MQLSVIIVNYKVRYFLEQCLLSVKEALRGIDSEIIVIDNNSPDDSFSMVKTNFPEVILIENKENKGFSKANNQGVKRAKGAYVLILNPDTVVAEDTFSKILNYAYKQENLGALGVKFIDGTGNFLPESKRGLPTPRVALKKLFSSANKQTGKYYASHLGEDETGTIDILTGAFMLIDRQKYNEVGGFDEGYFMYGEDIDISYSLLKKGYQNMYYPKTQIIHYKGESTAKNAIYLDNFYGAMRIFYQKHFKPNPIYDFVMLLGIKFWRAVKYLQINGELKPVKTPKHILYLGNDNTLYEALRKQYSDSEIHLFAVCETRVISRFDDLEKLENLIKDKQIGKIIFDNQSNTFSKIIFYMSSLKEYQLQFKIRPKNTSFIIGSNNKSTKGEVIDLQDYILEKS
jgi:GT2 family glycosyltransferase